ncbi:MAG: TauD/TfdA family dioxygenase [Planctomycetota bacterium]|nr:TauD/TfdA family dioxygenase [Planctomycetota bacterium]MDA1165765.1 TauD/TfdA family dioxygenase [Planctomycetota bacterium]
MSGRPIEVASAAVDGQQRHDEKPFPLVLECCPGNVEQNSVHQWIRESRSDLDLKSREYGAILFRGFPLATDRDFDRFVTSFDYPNFPYQESLSNAVRVNRTERVFTANEAPPHVTICLHHEMAQTPIYPSRLFFFCEQPAERGGATPLCRSDILFERLKLEFPEFIADCETKGLLYTNVMPAENDPTSGMGRSWQSTFRAETCQAAEERLQGLGYSWEWLPNGCLRSTTPVLPAVLVVEPGRKTFFNQLIAAFHGWKDSRNDPTKAITFGDGSPLNSQTMHEVARIAEELTFDIPWQAGDVALVDNRVVMHGRRTFNGTRKVLASLVAMDA